jgi:FtsZ-binding cell division protein ZapB
MMSLDKSMSIILVSLFTVWIVRRIWLDYKFSFALKTLNSKTNVLLYRKETSKSVNELYRQAIETIADLEQENKKLKEENDAYKKAIETTVLHAIATGDGYEIRRKDYERLEELLEDKHGD